MAIRFHNEECKFRLRDKRLVASWIKECIAAEGFRMGDITYIFCSPQRHIEINRHYLGHDYNTDVITFDYSDHAAGLVSGDIFIDPETVALNADRFGTDFRHEMLRVMVHGVLHLCGHKDKTAKQQKEMRAREDRCLGNIGYE